ncbi:MAG TPA: hypothetical protein VH641_01840 [Streptosporangiaceae bacterium]|jgi:hypothetical protein
MMLLGALSALLIAALLAAATCAWLLTGRALWRSRPAPHGGFDAQAALRRHPAGRSRAERGGFGPPGQGARPELGRPTGPDDDPDFISALERLIRGDEDEGY